MGSKRVDQFLYIFNDIWDETSMILVIPDEVCRIKNSSKDLFVSFKERIMLRTSLNRFWPVFIENSKSQYIWLFLIN